MDLRRSTFAGVILFLVGCGSSVPEPPKPTYSISITPFEARSGVQAGEAQTVSDALGSLLSQTGRFVVLDRERIGEVLQEQQFQAAQANSEAPRSEHILVVKKFLTGSLSKLGDTFILSLKLTDVESSRVDLSLSKTYDDDLEDIMDEFLPAVAQDILSALDGPSGR